MTDQEKQKKVILALDIALNEDCGLNTSNACAGPKCPYFMRDCFSLLADALALLEAQEPVEPIEMIDDFYPIGDPLRTIGWRCGKCGGRIGGYENYCPECGRAVKWD